MMLMKGIKTAIVVALLASPLLFGTAVQAGEIQDKTAILLVTFGTSVQSAMPAYDNLEQAVKDAFPGVEVRWAFTSKIIREKLASRDGRFLDDPYTAIARLKAEGYDKIVVQSDHIFAGQEFGDLHDVVNSYLRLQSANDEFGPRKMSLGKPLLYQQPDYVEVATAISSQFSLDDPSQAVVLMGHGSSDQADSAFGKLNDMLRHMQKNIFLGTVEGYPSLEEVKKDLAAAGVKKVVLAPFMNIAGDHACNDLYGDAPDSWQSQLQGLGYEAEGYRKGLLENKAIVDIFVKHLASAMDELDQDNIKEAVIRVNGERVKFSEPLSVSGDQVMAQMRSIFTSLGFDVSWNESQGTARAESSGLTVIFKPESKEAFVNGQKVDMDGACRLVNGSTMIPLSFLSKYLDCSISWDADNIINIFRANGQV